MKEPIEPVLDNTAYVESVGCMMRDIDADKDQKFSYFK